MHRRCGIAVRRYRKADVLSCRDRLAARIGRHYRHVLDGENGDAAGGRADAVSGNGLILIAVHVGCDVGQRQRSRSSAADIGESCTAIGADLPLHRRCGIAVRRYRKADVLSCRDRLAARIGRHYRSELEGENGDAAGGRAGAVGEDGLVLVAVHVGLYVGQRQRGRSSAADVGESSAAVAADLPLRRWRGIAVGRCREGGCIAGRHRLAARTGRHYRCTLHGEGSVGIAAIDEVARAVAIADADSVIAGSLSRWQSEIGAGSAAADGALHRRADGRAAVPDREGDGALNDRAGRAGQGGRERHILSGRVVGGARGCSDRLHRSGSQKRLIRHGRERGVLGMVVDLGRDLRGVRGSPVVVVQVDRGVGIARGHDAVRADIAEIVPGNVDDRAAIDRKGGEEAHELYGVGRSGIQPEIGQVDRAAVELELSIGVDDDLGSVTALGGVEDGATGVQEAAIANHDLRRAGRAVGGIKGHRVAAGERQRAIVGQRHCRLVCPDPDLHGNVCRHAQGSSRIDGEVARQDVE